VPHSSKNRTERDRRSAAVARSARASQLASGATVGTTSVNRSERRVAKLRLRRNSYASAPRRSRPLCQCVTSIVRFVPTRSAPLVEASSRRVDRRIFATSCAAAAAAAPKTAPQAKGQKTCFIRHDSGLRRCLESARHSFERSRERGAAYLSAGSAQCRRLSPPRAG